MKMRIFHQLDPRENRLPTDTGIRPKPMRRVPLVQPDVMIQNNPRIQQNLEPFQATDPAQVRAAARERLQRSVEAVNRKIEGNIKFKGVRFEVDEESGRTQAILRNRRTGEVLKRFPNEAQLDIAARLMDASGLLVDTEG